MTRHHMVRVIHADGRIRLVLARRGGQRHHAVELGTSVTCPLFHYHPAPGLVTFTAASLACSLAPSVACLVAFRMLQGIGASMLNPVSLAIVPMGL
jgi:MFS family permease